MKKIFNIIKSAFKNTCIYKKKFITSLFGIGITLVLLLTSAIFTNYFAKTNCVGDMMEPVGYALYYDPIKAFPSDLFQDNTHQIIINNAKLYNTAENKISISIYGVKVDFLNYPISTRNNDYRLVQTELLYGNSFSESDYLEGKPFLLMQESYALYLFGNENPIGKQLNIDNYVYYVKGILKDTYDVKNTFLKSEEKNVIVYTPQTVASTIYKEKYYSNIYIFHYDNENLLDYLDSSYIYYYKDARNNIGIEKVNALGKIIVPVLFIVISSSIIELIIIFINLRERYFEIGIKRAVGATKDEICFELLFENLILSFFGIVVGTIIGILLSYVVSISFYNTYHIYTKFLTFKEIAWAIAFSLVTALFSSLIPSIYAANSNIINIIKGD